MTAVTQQPFVYDEKYKFTEKWFDPMIPTWKQLFNQYPNEISSVLEIGCYEGRATVWLCENVLNDVSKEYTYDIVDSFAGSLNESGMAGTTERLTSGNFIKNNFNHNISHFSHINFNIYEGMSQQILPTFETVEKYDFIYIDASHRADDTFVDAYYAHKMLKKGGLLIFDDYGWKDPKDLHQVNSPQLGVEVFNTMYDSNYQVIMNGYQVAMLKK